MPHYLKDMGVSAAELQLQDRSPIQTPCHTRAPSRAASNENMSATMNITKITDLSFDMKENTLDLAFQDRSPTRTAFHSRSNSVSGQAPLKHSPTEAAMTMAALHEGLAPQQAADDKAAQATEEQEQSIANDKLWPLFVRSLIKKRDRRVAEPTDKTPAVPTEEPTVSMPEDDGVMVNAEEAASDTSSCFDESDSDGPSLSLQVEALQIEAAEGAKYAAACLSWWVKALLDFTRSWGQTRQ